MNAFLTRVVLLFLFLASLSICKDTPVLVWTNFESDNFLDFPDPFIRNHEQLLSVLHQLNFEGAKKIVIFYYDNFCLQDIADPESCLNFLYSKRENMRQLETLSYQPLKQEIIDVLSQNGHKIKAYDLAEDDLDYHQIASSVTEDTLFGMRVIRHSHVKNTVVSDYSENDMIMKHISDALSSEKTAFVLFASSSISGYYTELARVRSEVQDKLINNWNISSDGVVEGGPLLSANDCILFYYSLLKLKVGNSDACELSTTKSTASSTSCTSDFSVSFDDIDSCAVKNINIKLNIKKYSTQWNCETIVLSYLQGSEAKILNASCTKIAAPYETSYSCYKTDIFFQKEASLLLEYFQFQASKVKNGRFNDATDCSTYFTVDGIVALLVSFLMLLILSWGLIQLFEIRAPNISDQVIVKVQLGE